MELSSCVQVYVQDDVGASSFLTVFFLQLLVVGHNNEVSGASQRGRGDEAGRRLNKTARPCMHACRCDASGWLDDVD